MISPRATLLSVVIPLAAAASATQAAPPADEGTLHALLINGGDRPESNYLSHLHHLEDMVSLLRSRGLSAERIHVFSADGQDPAADLATREVPPAEFWILEGTTLGARLKPQTRLIDTRWDEVKLHPANRAALEEWFAAAARQLTARDRLLLFVTDHGTGDAADPEGGAISLWREKLTVRDLKALLRRLPAGLRVVMVMSQCYSGAFASAMNPEGASAPSGDVCGFFSTTAQQKAYGCYPEGRDRDRLGHAFELIEALSRRSSVAEAHVDVLAEDDTPDVPLRTSDAYLAALVQKEAGARGIGADALVDSLLAEAWRDRSSWEPEIRLLDRIGAAFGTFSPRSLGEIAARETEIEGLAKQMATFAESWKDALGGVQEAALRDFLRARPEWQPRLEARALDALSAEGRTKTLEELLPRLTEHARGHDRWSKLETFRDRAGRSAAARWRLEVRQAAFQRMRTILFGVAGRVLAARHPEDGAREAIARLQACESLPMGTPPAATSAGPAAAAPPFPPLSAEVALLEEVSPSWLGVRYRAVPPAARAQRGLPDGANFLDAVYPDSPAQQAGLKPGDIVLGTGERSFEFPRELREWTMTSPRGVPRTLRVLRPGAPGEADQTLEAALVLRVFPMDLPRLPDPPGVGQHAPPLPALQPVRGRALPALAGRAHLLFFWATWCGPCKRAVPEVLALAESRGLPVLAISDEDEETVSRFLADWTQPFFSQVAVDTLRHTFRSFGVSGTPTLLLVDGDGTIRHRQVGYAPDKGLTVEGWSWRR